MTGDQPFEVHFDRSGRELTASVSGELDPATAPELQVIAERWSECPTATVWLDLSNVTFCDSSGLTTINTLSTRAAAEGVRFVVYQPSLVVNRLFQITGIDQVISVQHVQRSAEGELG